MKRSKPRRKQRWKYLDRIMTDSYRGWRVTLAKPGEWRNPRVKWFSDRQYGSSEAARKAALSWRNSILDEWGISLRKKRSRYPVRGHTNNISGVVGVYELLQVRSKPTGKTGIYHAWIATWMEGGKQVKRYFSVDALGEKEAFQAACRARYENAGILMLQKPRRSLPHPLPADVKAKRNLDSV